MVPPVRRRFGQHFLESAWVERLGDVIQPCASETFLEVGAGRGALTHRLARSGARVIAIEIDRDLATLLSREVPGNVTIIPGDFLKVDLPNIPGLSSDDTRVVGNLPYSIGAPILIKLLRASDHGLRWRDAHLMLQREVADRVTAEPGTRDWGPLAVAVRLAAEPSRVLTLPPGAFRPMPRVQSAVIRLRFRGAPVTVADREMFDRLVRSIFIHRRKTALNALRPFVQRTSHLSVEQVFETAAVDPRQRPGQLTLVELAELTAVLAKRPS